MQRPRAVWLFVAVTIPTPIAAAGSDYPRWWLLLNLAGSVCLLLRSTRRYVWAARNDTPRRARSEPLPKAGR